ncbi:MAG: hypothetical protein MHMPM18_004693 [Marteilia pararefringens]
METIIEMLSERFEKVFVFFVNSNRVVAIILVNCEVKFIINVAHSGQSNSLFDLYEIIKIIFLSYNLLPILRLSSLHEAVRKFRRMFYSKYKILSFPVRNRNGI